MKALDKLKVRSRRLHHDAAHTSPKGISARAGLAGNSRVAAYSSEA